MSELTTALVSVLGPSIPLVIKVGAFDSQQQLEAVLTAAAAAGVRGVSGINGLSRWACIGIDGHADRWSSTRSSSDMADMHIRIAQV